MSTRAFVARKTGNDPNSPYGITFEGRYVHSDGYPTGLGKWLFSQVKTFDNNLKLLTYLLIDTQTAQCGWSSLWNADLLIEAISPEEALTWFNVRMRHYDSGDYETWKDTPDGHIAEHAPRAYSKRPDESPWLVTEKDVDTWMEWGYVFDLENFTLMVFILGSPITLTATIDLTTETADFEAIENSRYGD